MLWLSTIVDVFSSAFFCLLAFLFIFHLTIVYFIGIFLGFQRVLLSHTQDCLGISFLALCSGLTLGPYVIRGIWIMFAVTVATFKVTALSLVISFYIQLCFYQQDYPIFVICYLFHFIYHDTSVPFKLKQISSLITNE